MRILILNVVLVGPDPYLQEGHNDPQRKDEDVSLSEELECIYFMCDTPVH